MDLRDFLRVLRKRWRLVVLCTLVGVGSAAAIIVTSTPRYEATTQLFVSAKDAGPGLSGLAQGGQFTQQRVQSYAAIVNSPSVTTAVAERLGHGLTGSQIAKEVSASAPLNTVLIDVRVSDTSPHEAQDIANAVSEEFSSFVDTLETPTDSTTSPVKVSVVKYAHLPVAPASPRKAVDLAVGLLFGLAIGVGGAVLRETLDRSVRDPEQLQSEFGLPPLGIIAYDGDAKKHPLIVQSDLQSHRSEAFRQLRTNLQFVDIDRAPRSIVVTSSIPNEGKTTTATNLAITLAQSGLRILLVEADLRRPKISEYLGIEGAVGLTSVLVGRAQLSDAVQSWGSGGELKVLASGPMPPNPSELLGSQAMTDLIRELELDYDLVLVDAPPLLPVTDAAVIATSVSGALLVVRHGHCRREQLARAVQSLQSVEATIYGVVVTMTPAKGPESGYSYGRGYRYAADTNEYAEHVKPEPRTTRAEGRHSAPSPYPKYPNTASVESDSVDPSGTRLHNEAYSPATALGEDPLEFFER